MLKSPCIKLGIDKYITYSRAIMNNVFTSYKKIYPKHIGKQSPKINRIIYLISAVKCSLVVKAMF